MNPTTQGEPQPRFCCDGLCAQGRNCPAMLAAADKVDDEAALVSGDDCDNADAKLWTSIVVGLCILGAAASCFFGGK
jgi:hypothetical protein